MEAFFYSEGMELTAQRVINMCHVCINSTKSDYFIRYPKPINTMARDYTKYDVFNVGENLNKRQLVFTIVKTG